MRLSVETLRAMTMTRCCWLSVVFFVMIWTLPVSEGQATRDCVQHWREGRTLRSEWKFGPYAVLNQNHPLVWRVRYSNRTFVNVATCDVQKFSCDNTNSGFFNASIGVSKTEMSLFSLQRSVRQVQVVQNDVIKYSSCHLLVFEKDSTAYPRDLNCSEPYMSGDHIVVKCSLSVMPPGAKYALHYDYWSPLDVTVIEDHDHKKCTFVSVQNWPISKEYKNKGFFRAYFMSLAYIDFPPKGDDTSAIKRSHSYLFTYEKTATEITFTCQSESPESIYQKLELYRDKTRIYTSPVPYRLNYTVHNLQCVDGDVEFKCIGRGNCNKSFVIASAFFIPTCPLRLVTHDVTNTINRDSRWGFSFTVSGYPGPAVQDVSLFEFLPKRNLYQMVFDHRHYSVNILTNTQTLPWSHKIIFTLRSWTPGRTRYKLSLRISEEKVLDIHFTAVYEERTTTTTSGRTGVENSTPSTKDGSRTSDTVLAVCLSLGLVVVGVVITVSCIIRRRKNQNVTNGENSGSRPHQDNIRGSHIVNERSLNPTGHSRRFGHVSSELGRSETRDGHLIPRTVSTRETDSPTAFNTSRPVTSITSPGFTNNTGSTSFINSTGLNSSTAPYFIHSDVGEDSPPLYATVGQNPPPYSARMERDDSDGGAAALQELNVTDLQDKDIPGLPSYQTAMAVPDVPPPPYPGLPKKG